MDCPCDKFGDCTFSVLSRERAQRITELHTDADRRLKPGFHYPSWRPELTAMSWRVTGFHYPSTRAVFDGRAFPLAELTGRVDVCRNLDLAEI